MFTNRRAEADEGFTLVEVLVSMALLAIVMTAALPALVAMIRTTVTVKHDTQAKNVSQERIEQLRDLRYHIDRQNGPFLDVLDIYYTNATAAGPTTTLTVGGTTLTGNYVSSAAAANGEPAAPFYRVTTGALAGMPGFTQTIDSQFITPNGGVVPATSFQGVYNSQTVGKDSAPSLMIGVTVITRWVEGSKNKTLRTYTRIGEERAALPVIQTQARAQAVDITSTGADGSTLELQGGVSDGDGSQSSGSTVAGYAAGALATLSGLPTASGSFSEFNLPGQLVSSGGSTVQQSAGGCSWYGFGRTAVTDVTGDVSVGLPKAPADVDGGTPPNQMSGYIADNSGGGCGLLSFDNLAGGGLGLASSTPLGYEMGAAPYVQVPDTGGGSAAAISGSSYVSSNVLTSVPQKSVSGAKALLTRSLVIFPNNPESGGRGLISATMTQASVDCGSGSPGVDGTIAGKYTMALGWWGRRVAASGGDASARWHTASWTYDSSSAGAPTLVAGSDAWDPTNTYLGNGTTLAQLVSTNLNAAGPATVNVGGTTGLRGFTDGILSISTASTLSNEAGSGFSSIKVRVGKLTCVADDTR